MAKTSVIIPAREEFGYLIHWDQFRCPIIMPNDGAEDEDPQKVDCPECLLMLMEIKQRRRKGEKIG